jgi:very-short-patch-repair endonuclease
VPLPKAEALLPLPRAGEGGVEGERTRLPPLPRAGEGRGEGERTRRARALRAASSDAERALWQHLRDRRLEGFKFRRQVPIGPFFADFACIEARLVIELDGGQHFEPASEAADTRRTQQLARHGYTVLRFDNRQMLVQGEAVLGRIREWLLSHDHPHPSPLPRAGEGANDKGPLPHAGEAVEDKARAAIGRPAVYKEPS